VFINDDDRRRSGATSGGGERRSQQQRRRGRRQYLQPEESGGGGGNFYSYSSRRKTTPVYHVSAKSEEDDQNEDDVLDDYYYGKGGGGRNDGNLSDEDYGEAEIHFYDRPPPPPHSQSAPYPPRPGSRPDAAAAAEYEARVRMEERSRYKTSRPTMVAEGRMQTRVQEIKDTSLRMDFLRYPPAGAARKGLWPRAAVAAPGGGGSLPRPETGRRPVSSYDQSRLSRTQESLTLPLKLVLTRRGERFKGREFQYTRGAWDDRAFAQHLLREYRSLKARQIGLLQKMTSYRVVSYVYFLQYHAYPAEKFPYGHWKISDRKSVTRRCDQTARNAFMWKVHRLGKGEMGMFSSQRGKDCPRSGRDWVCRLDSLVELGAVVDIEVKEQFDTVKIYIGLMLAVLSSLGVGLAYGFATEDRDFSTGFSIASWMITAFGFIIAAIAAGEFIGLEKPSAALNTGEELTAGTYLDRELMER
jgi:hypothetical protein